MTTTPFLNRRVQFFMRHVAAWIVLAALPACSQEAGGSGSGAAAKGRLTASGPVGLFFMTRYWSYTRTLEKAAWYFSADGAVYQNLESGLSAADLAAHRGPKGTGKVSGDQMEITWADGKTSKSPIEPDKGSPTFMWDMGIFTPVEPFTDSKIVVGKFEGGESLVHGGSSVFTSQSFEFRVDGTYSQTGVASVKASGNGTALGAGSQGSTTGTWKAEGYTLTLTGGDGVATRKIAFPFKDDDKLALPNRIYFGGLLLKRQ